MRPFIFAEKIDEIAEGALEQVNQVEQPASAGIQYDPFVRARNVPFRTAHRRRSISVFETLAPMETVYENPQEPKNKEN